MSGDITQISAIMLKIVEANDTHGAFVAYLSEEKCRLQDEARRIGRQIQFIDRTLAKLVPCETPIDNQSEKT